MKRIKAGALMVVIVISLFIVVICTMLIILVYNNLQIQRNSLQDQKLSRNLRSAVNLFLADSTLVPKEGEVRMDLFNSGNDSAVFLKYHWGMFTTVSVSAEDNGKTKTNAFFCGSGLSKTLDGCLYLADHNRPLAVGGDTRLYGKAYLPRSSVSAVFINQRAYSSGVLVNGIIQNSVQFLPDPDSRVVKNVYALTHLCGLFDTGNYSAANIPDSFECSFRDSAFVVHKKGAVYLSNKTLKGRIMIISDSLIDVNNTSRLENVILIAPVIRLTNGFKGSIQAFATDSLIIGNYCRLFYPSCIVLLKKTIALNQPQLSIGMGCTFSGLIYTYAERGDKTKTYVQLGTGTFIMGLIYVNGYLDTHATVSGTVAADYFIYRTSQTVFENYLVDAVIDRFHLPIDFAMPDVFNVNNTNKIMQWLN